MTAIVTKLATTLEEKEAIYRFRYSVYVEELGRYQTTADHSGRRLVDPEDDRSWNFYASCDGEIVGSFRVTWGGDGFSSRQIEQYGLAPFLAEIPAERLAVGERTMISPSWRGTDLFTEMTESTKGWSEQHDVRVVFGCCEPHLISMYLNFQQTYAPRNINSPEAGYLIPLIAFPHGPEVLEGVHGEPGLPRCVQQVLDGVGAITSPMAMDPDEYVARVADEVTALDHSIFEGFSRDELARCIRRSNVIACVDGDRLLKEGGAARNVFVVLSGALEVSHDDHVVGVVLPGEVVGETAFLLQQARTFDVDVLSDDTRLLSLSERTLRTLTDEDPVVAAKLLGNLSKLLCKRLAAVR